jgi:hypothetical protein
LSPSRPRTASFARAPRAASRRPAHQILLDLALEQLERQVEQDALSAAHVPPPVPAEARGPRRTLHDHNALFPRLDSLAGMRGVDVDCPECARRGAGREMVASEAELDGPARVLAVVICLSCGYTGCLRVGG